MTGASGRLAGGAALEQGQQCRHGTRCCARSSHVTGPCLRAHAADSSHLLHKQVCARPDIRQNSDSGTKQSVDPSYLKHRPDACKWHELVAGGQQCSNCFGAIVICGCISCPAVQDTLGYAAQRKKSCRAIGPLAC
jgi:hypothetical protein